MKSHSLFPYFEGFRWSTATLSMMRLLWKWGMGIDALDSRKETALMAHAREGNTHIVRVLLTEGANIYWRNSLGLTAFDMAVRENRVGAVQQLIAFGYNVNQLNVTGHTALTYAVRHGRSHIVCLLLDAGAKPDVCNIHGQSAVEVALRAGEDEIAHFLKEWQNLKAFMGNLGVPCPHARLFLEQLRLQQARAVAEGLIRRSRVLRLPYKPAPGEPV